MSVSAGLWQQLVGDRPIVTRLVVAVAAAMTVVLVLAAAFVYWRVSFALDRQIDQDLDAYQRVVERAVRTGQSPPADTPGQTFQVYDARGTVLQSNRDIPPLLGSGRLRELRASGEARFDVGRLLPPSTRSYSVHAGEVRSPSGQRFVASAISRRKHDEALRELLLQLGIADLLALLAASFVGYRTARAALDPVERYRRAVEVLGDGQGRLPVTAGRDDELSRLGHTFNALLSRLEASSEHERQFVADASHELRTPLSLMRAELEWARFRPRSESEMAATLGSLQGQVDRLVDLANALLDIEELRGVGPLPREDVALGDLLHEAVRGVVRDGSGVYVEAPLGRVRVNRRWVALAVSNLVANAVRHGAGRVDVTAETKDQNLRITVRDQGSGFPKEFRAHAFERFSRAEESRTTPGSGLGLALVQAVAQAHHGTVLIEDSDGGAGVVLVLPLHQPAEAASTPSG